MKYINGIAGRIITLISALISILVLSCDNTCSSQSDLRVLFEMYGKPTTKIQIGAGIEPTPVGYKRVESIIDSNPDTICIQYIWDNIPHCDEALSAFVFKSGNGLVVNCVFKINKQELNNE